MITYDAGRWGISFIFSCGGSVFPRALAWAIPSSVAAFVICMHVPHDEKVETVISQAWFAMSFVVGFLIVFRTQQGYSRYWEGASLLQNVKAYWLNATSNLVAFCTSNPEKQDQVIKFQHLLVRLISLLHCSSLQSVSMMTDTDFEIIESSGISREFLEHVHSHDDNKCFIVMQAVQQLVVENIKLGVLDIAPPIVSRVFQELSNGIVAVTNVRKITDIPFPFPYAQLVTVMLLTSWVVTPFVTGYLLTEPAWAASLTFIGQLGFWSINYIAAEIEMPFGDDANDLPIAEMQKEMNECLKLLMHPVSAKSPSFEYHHEVHINLAPAKFSSAIELPPEHQVRKSAPRVRQSVFHVEKIWPKMEHDVKALDSDRLKQEHSAPPESLDLTVASPSFDCATSPVVVSIQHAAIHGQLEPLQTAVPPDIASSMVDLEATLAEAPHASGQHRPGQHDAAPPIIMSGSSGEEDEARQAKPKAKPQTSSILPKALRRKLNVKQSL